jgi:hypothetical protein
MSAQTEAPAMADDVIVPDDDPEFDAELFARDPVFTRAIQVEIQRRAADMDRRRNILRDAQIDPGPC